MEETKNAVPLSALRPKVGLDFGCALAERTMIGDGREVNLETGKEEK